MTSDVEKETKPLSDDETQQIDRDKEDEILRQRLRAYDCNICLDMANDPVVSYCGHLFCWPCLHQWLETCRTQKICPVCKALVNENRVVPLYGRGCENDEDPRTKNIPPRPAGERSEPQPANMFGDWMANDGFYITLGVGTLPFFLFSSLLNFSFHIPALLDFRNRRGSRRYSEATNFLRRLFPNTSDEILPHLFFWIGVLFIFWLIFS